MQLYAGSSADFIAAARGTVADTLRAAFVARYRTEPGPGEVASWHNSLRCLGRVFEAAGLLDQGVLLEYQLPLTSRRLDCLVCGHDADGRPQAVVIELKQWSESQPAAGANEVATRLGGQLRDVLHPSAQVGQYRQYLADVHTAFDGSAAAVGLHACAYLHNYEFAAADALLDPKFDGLLAACPVYGAGQGAALGAYLRQRLGGGGGRAVLGRIAAGGYRPGKKLLDHVVDVVRRQGRYVLLDDQLLVFDRVLAAVLEAQQSQVKTAVLVQGGPGTGKSVVALHLLPALLRRQLKAHYATGSKAFTENLRDQFGHRSSSHFTYFNAYGDLPPNALDVVICDEAHRIRSSSNSFRTPAAGRSAEAEAQAQAQVSELLRVAWVSVFFIDDFQRVRPGEIGTAAALRQAALGQGIAVAEFTLAAQFRCGGSAGFVNWLDNTLAIRPTANVVWGAGQGYDFQVVASPAEVERRLAQRRHEGHAARTVAGFCWPWSDPRPDGQLTEDVVIQTAEFTYARPWNAKSGAGRLAPGIPKSSLWATAPGGANQVGCIYTAQGFEFDYVGVIVGTDLVYRQQQGGWVAQGTHSADAAINNTRLRPQQQLEFLRNTYKVLMTRGLRGCYVYFQDDETRAFFQSRLEAG